MHEYLRRSINRYLAFLDKLTPEQLDALTKYHTAIINGYIGKLKEDLAINNDPNLRRIVEILEDVT